VGIRYDEAATLAQSLSRFRNLQVTGLMTHFAVADDPEQTAFTRLQIERFDHVCDEFRRAGHEPEIFDLANSPGALSHPESRGNMVRLGGALYGLLDDIMRDATSLPDLKPVLSLRSCVAQVKRVPQGESLGYGRTFTTERDSLIALVPIGYADGYSRRLSNKGKAIVNSSIVPVVGRVSMDWTLLDVTDVGNVTVNDEVIFIGSDEHNAITAADLARDLDTIGYEITCRISSRVPRVFK
ncbi:MAG: alanine racemase, partial [Pyrinomonadaceae bacterium]